MKKPIIKYLLPAILVLGIVSCKNTLKNSTTEEEVLPDDIVELREDQIELAQIETGKVQLMPLNGTLKANGSVTVAPGNLAIVSAPEGGFIKNISLMPGSSVQKGEVLATIENQEFVEIQQAYLETKSKLTFAESEFKRHSELYKNDVYSEKNLEQVTMEYNILKTQLKAYEQKLTLLGIDASRLNENTITRELRIVAPISGYVKSCGVNTGKFVNPSDMIFEIINTDKLLLELSLFEKMAGEISAGQKIRFFINNETEEHMAVITQTGRSVEADRTRKVYARIENPCKRLMPGMYVNALIEGASGNVTALPTEAIVSFEDKSYIFIFNRNKTESGKAFTEYRMVEVETGVSDKGFTEVILPDNFIRETTLVVLKGAYNLLAAKKNAGDMAC